MSRLKNFSRNLATSYLQLGVNVIYSLVSIPLILHWLPRAEFGLWAVLVQLMSYMSLLDLGMTAAVARLLVDHKDERTSGNYGSLVKTAALVSFTQGLIVLSVVVSGAPLLASLMKIPAEHLHTFILLMRLQGLIVALNFSFRPLGMMLYAHQRMDLQAYFDMFNLISQLGLLILFLSKGCGIISFIYANAITAVISPFYFYWNCRRLRFWPQAGEWGAVSLKIFKEVFDYGKNTFIMGLGAQLITASQVIIVSRTMGLEIAATWSVGTKIFNLFVPLMCRPYGAALPGLYEMSARGENERIKERFRGLVVLTGSLGVLLGVCLGLCNSLFVTVWTSGKINWPPWNDAFLGLWIFFSSLQTTHVNFVNVTKQFGGARYIYFLEGICFFAAAILLNGYGGTVAILVTSNLCQLLFSCQYGFRLSSRYFKCNWTEVAFHWIMPCLKFAFVFVSVAILTWICTGNLPVVWRLIVHGCLAGVAGGFLFLRLGLPRNLIREAIAKLPPQMTKLFYALIPA